MASFYDQPAQANFLNTYVPIPFEEIVRAGASRQGRYDDTLSNLQAQQAALAQVPYIPGTPYEDYLHQVVSDVDNTAAEFVKKDLSQGIVRRQLQDRLKKVVNLEMLNKSAVSKQNYEKRLEAEMRLREKGLYYEPFENMDDPMLNPEKSLQLGQVYDYLPKAYVDPSEKIAKMYKSIPPKITIEQKEMWGLPGVAEHALIEEKDLRAKMESEVDAFLSGPEGPQMVRYELANNPELAARYERKEISKEDVMREILWRESPKYALNQWNGWRQVDFGADRIGRTVTENPFGDGTNLTESTSAHLGNRQGKIPTYEEAITGQSTGIVQKFRNKKAIDIAVSDDYNRLFSYSAFKNIEKKEKRDEILKRWLENNPDKRKEDFRLDEIYTPSLTKKEWESWKENQLNGRSLQHDKEEIKAEFREQYKNSISPNTKLTAEQETAVKNFDLQVQSHAGLTPQQWGALPSAKQAKYRKETTDAIYNQEINIPYHMDTNPKHVEGWNKYYFGEGSEVAASSHGWKQQFYEVGTSYLNQPTTLANIMNEFSIFRSGDKTNQKPKLDVLGKLNENNPWSPDAYLVQVVSADGTKTKEFVMAGNLEGMAVENPHWKIHNGINFRNPADWNKPNLTGAFDIETTMYPETGGIPVRIKGMREGFEPKLGKQKITVDDAIVTINDKDYNLKDIIPNFEGMTSEDIMYLLETGIAQLADQIATGKK